MIYKHFLTVAADGTKEEMETTVRQFKNKNFLLELK